MWGPFDLTHLLIVFLIFVPLEHLLPLHREQEHLRRQWLSDLIYLLFNDFLIKIGLLFTIGLTLASLKAVWPEGMLPAVAALPLWLQVILVTIVADIGFYFAHRAMHRVPWLWRFHAVHHSIEQMDALATHRVHPVDQVLNRTAALLPIYALGFSLQAIVVFTLIYQLQSLLIHANVKLGFGPLKWLLASPHFHHWHHANEKEAHDKNFAAQIALIDWIFGTLYMPKRMPAKYGTDDPVPETFHEQLVYPFSAKSGEEIQPAREANAAR